MDRDGDFLVERERERAWIERVLTAVKESAGSVLAVEGPPGIGKTALLDLLAQLADEPTTVLRARASIEERDLDLMLVRHLFAPVGRMVTAAPDLLDGAAGLASSLLGRPHSGDGLASPTRGELLHGAYWLVSNLADRAPLVLALDDLHWADRASVDVVRHLARRIADLPVVLALASRGREEDPAWDRLLAEAGAGATTVLRPAPLSADGVASVLERRFSTAVAPTFSHACLQATGGNPFLLRAMIDTLRDEGVSPTLAGTDRVTAVVPEDIRRAVADRVDRAGAGARALAQALVVLDDRAPLSTCAAVASLSGEETAAAADALVAAHVLGSARPPSFVHPLVREAVAAQLGAAERALLHDRAAEILHRGRAPDSEVARHLLASEPAGRPWAVAVLRSAAAESRERGAIGFTVACLQRAVDEVPTAAAGDLLADLARAQAAVGDARAPATLRAARDATTDPRERALLALDLAQTAGMSGNYHTEAAYLDGALTEVAVVDPDLALRLEAQMLGVQRLVADTRADAEVRLSELAHEPPAPSPATVVVLANLALFALERNEPRDVVRRLATRALEGGWLWEEHTFQYSYAANALMWIDDLAAADEAWSHGLERAGRQGRPVMAAMAYGWRSHLRYRAGDVVAAEADARLARDIVDLFDEHDWEPALPYLEAHLGDVLLERDPASAALHLDRDGEWERQVSLFLDARGRWRLAIGDAAGAVRDFLAAGEALRARGGVDTPAIMPWRSAAALAYAAVDEPDRARALATEELELAARVGAPRPIGHGLRALAAVSSTQEALTLLAQAADHLEQAGATLDLAKTLLQLGRVLRRDRQPVAARAPLARALDLATRSGSPTTAGHARHELLASGARPRRDQLTGVGSLTPTERRVAELAAGGQKNREIAEALFVSVRTVAVHLSNSYRKLGVSGRGELAAALRDEDHPPEPLS